MSRILRSYFVKVPPELNAGKGKTLESLHTEWVRVLPLAQAWYWQSFWATGCFDPTLRTSGPNQTFPSTKLGVAHKDGMVAAIKGQTQSWMSNFVHQGRRVMARVHPRIAQRHGLPLETLRHVLHWINSQQLWLLPHAVQQQHLAVQHQRVAEQHAAALVKAQAKGRETETVPPLEPPAFTQIPPALSRLVRRWFLLSWQRVRPPDPGQLPLAFNANNSRLVPNVVRSTSDPTAFQFFHGWVGLTTLDLGERVQVPFQSYRLVDELLSDSWRTRQAQEQAKAQRKQERQRWEAEHPGEPWEPLKRGRPLGSKGSKGLKRTSGAHARSKGHNEYNKNHNNKNHSPNQGLDAPTRSQDWALPLVNPQREPSVLESLAAPQHRPALPALLSPELGRLVHPTGMAVATQVTGPAALAAEVSALPPHNATPSLGAAQTRIQPPPRQVELKKGIELHRRNGEWHLKLVFELDAQEWAIEDPHREEVLGLDLGLRNFLASSKGDLEGVDFIEQLYVFDAQYQALQKGLQQAGVQQWSQCRRHQRLMQRIRGYLKTNIRRWLRRVLQRRRPHTVVIEALSFMDPLDPRSGYRGLGPRLNRLVRGFGQQVFKEALEQWSAELGFTIQTVDAHYSSQTCRHCAFAHKGSRRGNQYRCVLCRAKAHSDVQAASHLPGRSGLEPLVPGFLTTQQRWRVRLFKEWIAGLARDLQRATPHSPWSQSLVGRARKGLRLLRLGLGAQKSLTPQTRRRLDRALALDPARLCQTVIACARRWGASAPPTTLQCSTR